MIPNRIIPVIENIKHGMAQLKWPKPPRNIFITKKAFDKTVLKGSRDFLQHLHATYPVNIIAEPDIHQELELPFVQSQIVTQDLMKDKIDLIVSMGGDGTILRAVSLMKNIAHSTPPVLAFSMGTLGFLLPFDYKDSMQAFRDVYENRASVTKRSRISVGMPDSSTVRALNDVTIHRGASPHLTELEISIDGQYLTTAIADGISISTPTGSTAYSLSAGGSIVHPGVECMLLTPICPRSLSFRPLVLPQDSRVSISISKTARGGSSMSLDGGSNVELERGDKTTMEIHPDDGVWCVTKKSETIDWVGHLNELLGFNSKFGKKGSVYKL